MPRSGIAIALALSATAGFIQPSTAAHAQAATIPVRPTDTAVPPDIMYPDAVICDVNGPDGITYKIIFYKSQTTSFPHEPNNVADYGTPFLRDADKFDAAVTAKWHLQLGQPGAVTLLTLPAGWTTTNCAVGTPIADLIANKQALKTFTPMTPDR